MTLKTYEDLCRGIPAQQHHESIQGAPPGTAVGQPVYPGTEEYYGVSLFERIGRGITPTEAGKEFYGYAIHIVDLFEEMEKKIRNWDTLGKLRLGASITIGTHILPVLIQRYQKEFAKLRIEVIIDKSAVIEEHILEQYHRPGAD